MAKRIKVMFALGLLGTCSTAAPHGGDYAEYPTAVNRVYRAERPGYWAAAS